MTEDQTLFHGLEQKQVGGMSAAAAALCHLPLRAPVRRDARETSREAARAVEGTASHVRTALLRAFIQAGQEGLTDDEGQSSTGINGNTYRPRRVELERLGLVTATALRRRTQTGRSAAVFRATTAAVEEVAGEGRGR